MTNLSNSLKAPYGTSDEIPSCFPTLIEQKAFNLDSLILLYLPASNHSDTLITRRQQTSTMDDFDMGLLDDKTYMVSVLRQKMLGIAPVFMYRIKDEKAPGQDYLYVNICLTSLCLFVGFDSSSNILLFKSLLPVRTNGTSASRCNNVLSALNVEATSFL